MVAFFDHVTRHKTRHLDGWRSFFLAIHHLVEASVLFAAALVMMALNDLKKPG
jgi:hypothetical protein